MSLDTRKEGSPQERLRDIEGSEGQDLAEYAMLLALIALVVVLAVAALGGALATLWGNITAAFAALP